MMKNFNIPNLLSAIRIILVPVFVYYYYLALQTDQFLIPVIIMAVSGISDLLDGYIARKYNQITDLGKILDPVADKLTQIIFAFCLVFRFPLAMILLAIMVVKDLLLLLNIIVVLKNKEEVEGAKMWGKVATTVFYIGAVILLVMPGLELWMANTIIFITSGCMFIAMIKYINHYFGSVRNIRKSIRK